MAEARAAQELGGREGLPVVQHDALARLPHRHEAPLGHPPTGPHEPEPRPQAHSRRARWILAISTYSEAITKSWAGRMERLEKSSVA